MFVITKVLNSITITDCSPFEINSGMLSVQFTCKGSSSITCKSNSLRGGTSGIDNKKNIHDLQEIALASIDLFLRLSLD
jgi:hypothetical protein